MIQAAASTVFGGIELAVGALAAVAWLRLAPKLSAEEKAKDSIIVCPSPLLNQQVVDNERRKNYVVSFVNSACLSPAFQIIRPERMFLIDPAFFQSRSDYATTEILDSGIENTLARIVNATNWPMKVIIPWHYRGAKTVKRLQENPNIAIVGIPVLNARSRQGYLRALGFRLGLLNPVYQNVLVAAIFYSLKAGHHQTIIWGAHHTWLSEVVVNNQNQVLHSVRHSDKQHIGIPLVNSDGTPRRYHTYLQQLATVFEQYHVLKDYAERTGQEIVNATDHSFIDAFKRNEMILLFSVNSSASEKIVNP